MGYDFLPFIKKEHKLFFSTGKLTEKCSAIGYLRADFGNGNEFFSTWFDRRAELKSYAFKKEFDNLINYLRNNSEKPLLRSRKDLTEYCNSVNAQYVINGLFNTSRGVKIRTESYSYYLRFKPCKNDYELYCFCYDNRYLPDCADSGTNKIN